MPTHRARKRFGQNFLIDSTVIDQIIQTLNPAPHDLMVEIGPGLGALTQPLLKCLPQLHVIELDRDCVFKLKQLAPPDKLIIHAQDVLMFDFSKLNTTQQKIRIIGNLPYNISTPVIFLLLKNIELIADIHIMLQKEVAERISAICGSKHYGRLSVMVQYHCDVEACFDVPPEAFSPTPNVQSTFVKLTPKSRSRLTKDLVRFEEIVRLSFQQRRKTLHNNLRTLISDTQLKQLNINPQTRAEQLDVEAFIRLSNL